MESGIVNRKRYFVPFFYCPNIFISTQEKLKEYDLNFSDFPIKNYLNNFHKKKFPVRFLEMKVITIAFCIHL